MGRTTAVPSAALRTNFVEGRLAEVRRKFVAPGPFPQSGTGEREMKTIISDEERRRRSRRRKNPEMTRQEYEDRAADRRLEARRMASEGMSRQEIAKTLGWSKRHVQRVLNEDSGEG